jgi:hypothetical protein
MKHRRRQPRIHIAAGRQGDWGPGPCLDGTKKLKTFQDFPSHQIFVRIHEVLNVDKKNN